MWVEAVFAREDVERLLTAMMPLTIAIGDEGDHLVLAAPKNVAFAPGEGLRAECEARLRWSVLGIHVPITIHEVRALLRPEIVAVPDTGDVLWFRLRIEQADFAGVPDFIDRRVTERVNEVLEGKRLAMSWDFSETLRGTFALPASLRPLETLSLAVAWGKIRITEEALVLAISFHSTVGRAAEPAPVLPVVPSGVDRRPGSSDAAGRLVLGAAALALALGSAYGAYRLGARRQPRRHGFVLARR